MKPNYDRWTIELLQAFDSIPQGYLPLVKTKDLRQRLTSAFSSVKVSDVDPTQLRSCLSEGKPFAPLDKMCTNRSLLKCAQILTELVSCNKRAHLFVDVRKSSVIYWLLYSLIYEHALARVIKCWLCREDVLFLHNTLSKDLWRIETHYALNYLGETVDTWTDVRSFQATLKDYRSNRKEHLQVKRPLLLF